MLAACIALRRAGRDSFLAEPRVNATSLHSTETLRWPDQFSTGDLHAPQRRSSLLSLPMSLLIAAHASGMPFGVVIEDSRATPDSLSRSIPLLILDLMIPIHRVAVLLEQRPMDQGTISRSRAERTPWTFGRLLTRSTCHIFGGCCF
jgi:hypothetical protein